MKFHLNHHLGRSLLTVVSSENCDTDSWPMVSDIEFRRYEGTPDPEIGAIGAAILFARHCGDIAEFADSKIGVDTARAIRTILPQVEELHPIDGRQRSISQGVSALIVGEARQIMGGSVATADTGRSAQVISWSGDFVDDSARVSTRHVDGGVFTNARLVAGQVSVSAALALLSGGKNVRDIYVPGPSAEEESDYRRIADGLDFIGVKLHGMPQSQTQAAAA
ncbi:MAG: hypothetical protein ACTSYE_11910 [Alphaproteobacteria bacterium]